MHNFAYGTDGSGYKNAIINNFGLRNLEFNGTNDRLQLEFILKHLNENTVVFDIGANYGYYCLTNAKNI